MLLFIHGGGMDVRRPREPRRDVPVPRRAVRRAGPRGRLPAGPRAPVPGGRRGPLGGVPLGRSSTPTTSAPTRAARGRRRLGGRLPRRGRPRSGPPRRACRCAFQLLVYPATDMARSAESRRLFGERLLPHQRVHRSSPHVLRARGRRPTDPRCHALVRRRSRRASRPRSSSPRGSTRCATRARPTPRQLADAGVTVELRRYPGWSTGSSTWSGWAGRAAPRSPRSPRSSRPLST